MKEPLNVPVDIIAAGVNTLIPAQSGRRIAIIEYQLLNVAGAQDIQLLDGASPLTGLYAGFPAMSAIGRVGGPHPAWILRSSSPFQILTSVGSQVSGYVSYILVPDNVDPMEFIYGPQQVYLGPMTQSQREAVIRALGETW